MNKNLLRWVPAAVVPVLIAAGVIAAHGATDVSLPTKTPEQVLTLVGQSSVTAFSGTIEQSSNLGLPALPSVGPSANAGLSSALEFLTGSHTARVFVDGPTNARVQVIDTLAERDLVRNGAELWAYDSSKATATHLRLPAGGAFKHPGAVTPDPDAGVQTPAQLAHRLLAELTPSTTVSLGDNASVAGRSAYDLVLTPRTSATLVGSVSIAVDAKTGMPLRVEVNARGQKDAAVSIAFTDVSLQAPAASTFDFTAPKGTTVKQQTLPQSLGALRHTADHAAAPKVIGSDWASIVELPAGTVPASALTSPLLAQASSAVSGGRLLSTSLVNVFVASDGRVFAGSVPASALQAAASDR
ncbi:LolA family protein [Leifsonia sp. Root112D2]|uniref:LolA family protein n=1 Tax=Leifsonia sp. Root112D2 TaxID=1736426 RepID=UPI000A444FDD|nr:outer membrane lipoprotein carrier protein LolA [Leifsonia sp. Root112D2]